MKFFKGPLIAWITRLTGQPERRHARILAGAAVTLVVLVGGIAFASLPDSPVRQTLAGVEPQQTAPPTTDGVGNVVPGVTPPTVAGQDPVVGGTPTTGSSPGPPTLDTTTTELAPVVTTPSGKPVVTVPPGGWQEAAPAGLSLTITPSAKSVSPAQEVTFSALVVDASGGLKQLSWDFGDGTSSTTDPRPCDDPLNRPTIQNGQTNFPARVSHTYRAPGDYSVKATAVTGTRCGSKANDENVTAIGKVTVTSGPTLSNGPAFPTVTAAPGAGGMPEDPHVEINVTMGDSDGFVSQVVIDWNDPGAAPTVEVFPRTSCVDSPLRWPASLVSINAGHDYLNAGTHNVTITVTTTGCDGEDPQEAIDVVSVIAGGSATAVTLPL